MKKAGAVAFGGILCALCVVIMFLSAFPYLTYAVPALAGLCMLCAVAELGTRRAALCFVASAFLSLLLTPDKEAALLFLCFFGYYPIIKVPIEKIKARPIKLLLKLAVFNIAVAAVYFVFMRLIGMDGGFGGYARAAIAGIWLLANAVFIIYDFELVRIAAIYCRRISPLVGRYFRR